MLQMLGVFEGDHILVWCVTHIAKPFLIKSNGIHLKH